MEGKLPLYPLQATPRRFFLMSPDPEPLTPSRWRLVPALATALLFASSFLAAEVAREELDPLQATTLRYLIAAAFLGALAVRAPRVEGAPDLPRWLPPFLGLTGILGYQALFFAALAHTSTANTALLNATSPVVTGAVAAIVVRERLTTGAWCGIALSVGGVAFLVTGATLEGAPGEWLMLGAVLCWALYAVAARDPIRRHGSLRVTTTATLWGLALALPLALAFGGLPAAPSASTSVALLYMGVGASGVGYLLYGRSVAALGPTRTAAVVYGCVPPLVASLRYAWKGDPVGTRWVIATLLVLAGLTLTLRDVD